MAHYRNLMITKFIRNPEDMLNMAAENLARIEEQSRHITMDEIRDAVLLLSRTINEARWSTQPRILLELAIISIASGAGIESSSQQSPRKYGAQSVQQMQGAGQTASFSQGQTAQFVQGQAMQPGGQQMQGQATVQPMAAQTGASARHTAGSAGRRTDRRVHAIADRYAAGRRRGIGYTDAGSSPRHAGAGSSLDLRSRERSPLACGL